MIRLVNLEMGRARVVHHIGAKESSIFDIFDFQRHCQWFYIFIHDFTLAIDGSLYFFCQIFKCGSISIYSLCPFLTYLITHFLCPITPAAWDRIAKP